MMRYHVITYGCQMNTADSEEMSQPLASRGFTSTPHLQDADIVLMNTWDDFVTDAAPAMGLVLCLLFLIYSLITALQLRHSYKKVPGSRLAKLNLWLMIIAAILYPMSVASFLP
jgi:hypothetical protein